MRPCKRLLYPQHYETNNLKDVNNQKINWPDDDVYEYHAVLMESKDRTPRLALIFLVKVKYVDHMFVVYQSKLNIVFALKKHI